FTDPVYQDLSPGSQVLELANREYSDDKFVVVTNADDILVSPLFAYVSPPNGLPVPGRSWTESLGLSGILGHGAVFRTPQGAGVIASIFQTGTLPVELPDQYSEVLARLLCNVSPDPQTCLGVFNLGGYSPVNILIT